MTYFHRKPVTYTHESSLTYHNPVGIRVHPRHPPHPPQSRTYEQHVPGHKYRASVDNSNQETVIEYSNPDYTRSISESSEYSNGYEEESEKEAR